LTSLLTSDEKATDFLIAHPDIIDSVKGIADGVARNNGNKLILFGASRLLKRFPRKVQHSCAKQLLEDSNRMRQALEATIEQQRGDNGAQGELKTEVAAQKKENFTLKKEVASQKRKIDAQAREIAALRETVNNADACASSRH
jgi:hypothetical protein